MYSRPGVAHQQRAGMATSGTIQLRESAEEVEANYLPCNVGHCGRAKVSTFFEPVKDSTREGVLSASIRGREILGKRVPLPDGYKGMLVEAKVGAHGVGEGNTEGCQNFKQTGSFSELTYWCLDKRPDNNDEVGQALAWMETARAVHDPISLEDVEKLAALA